jgi:hypothetical protein
MKSSILKKNHFCPFGITFESDLLEVEAGLTPSSFSVHFVLNQVETCQNWMQLQLNNLLLSVIRVTIASLQMKKVVESICKNTDDNTYYLQCCSFAKKDRLYTYPRDSKTLGIFRVNKKSHTFPLDVNKLSRKYFLLPLSKGFVCIAYVSRKSFPYMNSSFVKHLHWYSFSLL